MAATELTTGASLGEDGRYRLRQMLGTGGMASVWLANDARLGRPVAIKVLADSLALDAGYVSRFRREALVAARVSHPNLVNIYDFGADTPRPYLVMEYVEGGTLADRLRGRQRRDWEPETVFRELISALVHVHGAGIVHRDIKPGNLLIGRDGRARLTDFGVARPSGAEQLTSTGLVIGTARYIAPEILHGRPANERSDLYACGVLLDDCLGDQGPRRLRVLADTLTNEDPRMRPASATEVLELLERPASVITRPRTASTRTLPARIYKRRAWSSGPARAALITAALAVLVVVFVVVSASAGSRKTVPRLAVPPAGAPLSAQLDGLDRIIGQARR